MIDIIYNNNIGIDSMYNILIFKEYSKSYQYVDNLSPRRKEVSSVFEIH